MDQTEINYIIAIAEEKNISKAADRLFISQPALSKYLHEHEKIIGGKLFERRKGEMVPTKLGNIYISYARRILNLSEECSRRMREVLLSARKVLQLGIPYAHAEQYADLISDLHRLNPDILFHIVCGTCDEIREHMINGSMDLAVMDGSDGILLKRERIGVIISDKCKAAETLSAGQPVTISDLKHEVFFLSTTADAVSTAGSDLLKAADIRPSQIVPIESIELAQRLAEKDGGVAFAIEGDVSDGFHQLVPELTNDVRLCLKSIEAQNLNLKGIGV